MVSNMKDYDVVVIGAGISGLLSALALSKEGKKVLILEKKVILEASVDLIKLRVIR